MKNFIHKVNVLDSGYIPTLRILDNANQAVCSMVIIVTTYTYKACRQHGLSGAMKEGEYYQQRMIPP